MLEYRKANPSRNFTALVETPTEAESRLKYAAEIMSEDPEIEQVAFLSESGDPHIAARLDLAGGEFCGNACLSAAALLLEKGLDVVPGEPGVRYKLSVSGAEEPVEVYVERDGDGYLATASLPLPTSVEKKELVYKEKKYKLTLVNFAGVSHLICARNMAKKFAEEAVAAWCEELDLPALGIMFLDGSKLKPLVYVSGGKTLRWEQSCASGSAAVGVWLALDNHRSTSVLLEEPGGTLRVAAAWADDKITSLRLTGNVEL